MTDIPFITVGEEELGERADEILCPHCGKMHPIKYGTSRKLLPDGTRSNPISSKLVGAYKCNGKLYLGTINGRLIK